MPRKNIHLIKASQATPFIETASRLGAPVKLIARRAGLPLSSAKSGDGVIGEPALWRFIELTSHYPGCAFLGYLTALDHPIASEGRLGGMPIALSMTLAQTLEGFFRDVIGQSDSCDYQLVTQGKHKWFTRKLVIRDGVDGWQPELYVLMIIIQIVRLFAPGDWLPRRLRFATRQVPEPLPAEWISVDAEWGWHRTEMLIEEKVLCLPSRFTDGFMKSETAYSDRQNLMHIQDLIDRQIWSRHTGLAIAASELGMSMSTLKRRLTELNTSYSELLEARRLQHATRLLKEPRLSVKRIADDLGYSATSNFSRAFTCAMGSSPMAYRKWHAKQ